MAFTIEFDAGNRILRARFHGLVNDLTMEEFSACKETYLDRTSPRAIMLDYSEVTALQVSSAEVRALAASAAVAKDPHLVRIIVAPAAHIFGLSRMFQILAENTHKGTVVVRSREEALQILKVAQPNFEAVDAEEPGEQAI